jgi:hypothetical protein
MANARADKLHDLIFDVAIFKHRANDSQSHILRADARNRLAGQINGNNARIINIPGIV